MTSHADPPKGAITAAEFARIQAEAGGPGMICICAPILDPPPPLSVAIVRAMFPALRPEREAEAS